MPFNDVDKFFHMLIMNDFVLLSKVKSVDVSQFLSYSLCQSGILCYLCMSIE